MVITIPICQQNMDAQTLYENHAQMITSQTHPKRYI